MSALPAGIAPPPGAPLDEVAATGALAAVVRLSASVLGAPLALVALFEADGATVPVQVGFEAPGAAAVARRAAEGASATGPYEGAELAAIGVAMLAVAPLGGATRGALCVARAASDAFDAGDLARLAELADVASRLVDLRAAFGSAQARERAEAELRKREQQLAEAQQIAQLGSWEWDVPGDTITWSDELYRIYGTDARTFRATFEAFIDLVHPDDRGRVQRVVQEAFAARSAFTFEHRIVRPDGTTRTLLGRGKIVLGDDGAPARMVGTALDVTERREAQERERELVREQARRAEAERGRLLVEQKAEELARLAAELERSNRDLDQFAYAASHDLKAPLRGISSLASWIEEDLADDLTPEAHEYLDLLHARIGRMEALVEGILAYSRAGRGNAEPQRVDVGGLVREVADMLHPPESVAVVIEDGLPIFDAELAPLQRVLLNLVGNAVKHAASPGGTVRVGASLAGDQVEFFVSDDGPGIAPSQQEKIWLVFHTLPSRATSEGTGVGLAVVKKLVERQGGRAWVESDVGRGATFRFLWPRVPKAGGWAGPPSDALGPSTATRG